MYMICACVVCAFASDFHEFEKKEDKSQYSSISAAYDLYSTIVSSTRF